MDAQTTADPSPEPVPETEEQKDDSRFKWFKIILITLGVIALAGVLIFYFGTPCTENDASTIKKIGCAIGDALGAFGKVLAEVANNFWAIVGLVFGGGFLTFVGKITIEWYKKSGEKPSGIKKDVLDKDKENLQKKNDALREQKDGLQRQADDMTKTAEQRAEAQKELDDTNDKIDENQDKIDKITKTLEGE